MMSRFSDKLKKLNILGAIITSLLIGIILLTVVFLLDNQIKYALYVFGLSLAGLLFLIAFGYRYKFKLSFLGQTRAVDYFFILCSFVTLTYCIFHEPITKLGFIFPAGVVYLLPGWVLIRLIKFDSPMRVSISLIVLSFLLSIGISSIIFMFTFSFKIFGTYSAIFLSIVYVGLSFIALIKDKIFLPCKERSSYKGNQATEYSLLDIMLVAWVCLFFIFIISSLYPQMAYVPGNDIARLLSASKQAVTTPNLFNSEYPWFNFPWASLNELALPAMWLFQTGVAYLSIILILSFYIVARVYLRDIDNRAHLFATAFFSVFSGFGWLYFVQKNLTSNHVLSNHFDILTISHSASYWDIGLGQSTWLWFWFRPITVGFAIFFLLLYLMRREDLTRGKYITVSSLLVLILAQVHFPELVVFAIFVFILALFLPKTKLRIKEMALATLIGLAGTFIISIIYGLTLPSEHPSTYQYLPAMIALVGLTFILLHYPKRPRIKFRRMDIVYVTVIALFVYIVIFSYWFTNADNFSIQDISRILAIPLEFYPVLLGIVGIFTIPSLGFVFRRHTHHPIILFLALLFVVLVFGKLLTYINANIENTSYWERRTIPLIFFACSVLAPISVLNIIDWLRKQKIGSRLEFRNALVVVFLSFVVITGVLSTFLTVEFNVINDSKRALTADEHRIESSFDNINPSSTLLTLSGHSKDLADYANVAYIPDFYRYQVWSSQQPELPLNILSRTGGPIVIYVSKDDSNQITGMYRNGFIASHILRVAPIITRGTDGSALYQIPKIAPPSSRSNMILVVPESGNEMKYYAYDVLSLSGLNYTTVLLRDISSIGKAKIVIVPSEQIALKLMHYRSQYGLHFEKLIILNLDGYGSLVDFGKNMNSNLITNTINSSWIASGFGHGKTGIPQFTDNSNKITSKNDTLAINVGAGKYSMWQISQLLYKSPLQLGNFNFIKFSWYGKDNGKWYVLQFTTEPKQYFWYRFQDTWNGWKQITLPLNSNNQSGNLFGVNYYKLVTHGASWSKISRIDFRTEASNQNQTGKFYLSGFGFGNFLHSSGVMNLDMKKEIQFPTKVDVNSITPGSGFDPIGYYDVGVPFSLHKKYNNYDIYYLNIYPIIHELTLGRDNARGLYPLLGELLNFSNIELPAYKPSNQNPASLVNGGVAAFNSAYLNGELTLKSPSAIIDTNSTQTKININEKTKFILNGTMREILPINIENTTIKSERGALLHNGFGYYMHGSMNQSSVKFTGSPAVLLLNLGTGNSNKSVVVSGNEIEFNLPTLNVMLRQPEILFKGSANFADFYAYGDLSNKIRALGENLGVNGKVDFSSNYADSFIVSNNTSLDGKITLPSPVYNYNELATFFNILTLPNIIRYTLTILSLYLILDFVNKKKMTFVQRSSK